MKKILCVSSTGMGNAILYLPVIRSLRKHYPDAIIDLLLSSKAASDLLEGVKEINHVIYFDKKSTSLKQLVSFLCSLRKTQYDMYVTSFLDSSTKVGLLGKILGIPERIGFKKNIIGSLFTKAIESDAHKHEVQYNLELVKTLGITENVTDISLNIQQDTIDSAMRRLPKQVAFPRIGFHPGSGSDIGADVKRWPIEKYIELADMLSSKMNAQICIFGGKEEAQLVESMKVSLKKHADVFVNQNIKTTAALISCCHIFISNDSGLMHIAAAMKVPVIGIFGPTLWWKNYPWETAHVVMRNELPCAPCYNYSSVLCQDRKCLSGITVESVYDSIHALLSEKRLIYCAGRQ